MKSGLPVPLSRTVIPAPRAINRTLLGGPDCASKAQQRASTSRIVVAPTIHHCVEATRKASANDSTSVKQVNNRSRLLYFLDLRLRTTSDIRAVLDRRSE